MKTFNQTNFFKHTFCEFQEVAGFVFPESKTFKSKSDSNYFYTDEGVYRKSNHWGRVANCRWKIISKGNYKNQKTVIGFAKWSDFHPINSTDKNFFIHVDFTLKKATIHPKQQNSTGHPHSFSEAQKKIKQINHLFKNNKWTKHFETPDETLLTAIISEFINSNKTLQRIKSEKK